MLMNFTIEFQSYVPLLSDVCERGMLLWTPREPMPLQCELPHIYFDVCAVEKMRLWKKKEWDLIDKLDNCKFFQ